LAWKFLIDSDVLAYPLDLQRLIRINGWNAVSYQKSGISPHKPSEVIFADGRIILLFDEQIERKQLRFHIAHEIGHIVLGHYCFDSPAIYEKEATMFARRILMPMTLIHNLQLCTAGQIADVCDVPLCEAEQRLNRYLNILTTRGKFDSHTLELELKRRLGL